MSPVTKDGPTKGTLFYMASDGVMKMQMDGVGEVYIGRYTYVQATGLITPTFNKIGTETLVLKKL